MFYFDIITVSFEHFSYKYGLFCKLLHSCMFLSCYSNCEFLPSFSQLAFKSFATIVTLFYSIVYIFFLFSHFSNLTHLF